MLITPSVFAGVDVKLVPAWVSVRVNRLSADPCHSILSGDDDRDDRDGRSRGGKGVAIVGKFGDQ